MNQKNLHLIHLILSFGFLINITLSECVTLMMFIMLRLCDLNDLLINQTIAYFILKHCREN